MELLIQSLVSNPKIVAILLAAYAVLEWWMGRTKKVKANSGIDLIGDALKGLVPKRKR